MNMKAFHTLRTRENFSAADFEIFTMILSALKWREKNGAIKLVTDSRGAEYFNRLGLSAAWNEIDTSLDEMNLRGWDEKIFWAGAKLFALSRQVAPVVMIDLDFIAWQRLDFAPFATNIAVIHREEVNNSIYPDKNFFRLKNGQNLPAALDWSVEACNTAFAYFGANDFIKRYTNFAFELMTSLDTTDDVLSYMVFVEQRWAAMCAALMHREIFSLSSLENLFGRQKYFTHLWGSKQKFRDNLKASENFCRNCARRIQHDFPCWAEKLRASQWAGKYF